MRAPSARRSSSAASCRRARACWRMPTASLRSSPPSAQRRRCAPRPIWSMPPTSWATRTRSWRRCSANRRRRSSATCARSARCSARPRARSSTPLRARCRSSACARCCSRSRATCGWCCFASPRACRRFASSRRASGRARTISRRRRCRCSRRSPTGSASGRSSGSSRTSRSAFSTRWRTAARRPASTSGAPIAKRGSRRCARAWPPISPRTASRSRCRAGRSTSTASGRRCAESASASTECST